MNVVLISTYELGRQPFGLASPAAWLRGEGHRVRCIDVSRESLDETALREADLIALYVPMHTAARLAIELIDPIRRLNPRARLCFYGLYAPASESYFRRRGVEAILGGEFETGLLHLARRMESQRAGVQAWDEAQTEPVISLERQEFLVPDRSDLVPLDRYARLTLPGGGQKRVGYTEASRGCKHRCRHCPVVPVYNGIFRVVPPEVVIEDIRGQVAAGAEHITFGDPDFFNGPRHALAIVQILHREFPALTYDVTIKVEHLLGRRQDLAALGETGCLFVTSAVESLDDAVLAQLEKGHTRADFFEVVRLFDEAGLTLHPTFIPFTPWTTREGYADLLDSLASLGLVENVAPVQLSIRLLVTAGSRLLELDEIRKCAGPFDQVGLVYPWRHPDPKIDRLQREIEAIVKTGQSQGLSRSEVFGHVCLAAAGKRGEDKIAERPVEKPMLARAAIPYLTEPWYC